MECNFPSLGCPATLEHYIYLIEHDHLALGMVVVVVEPTPLCDRPTLGYYLFAPGKRHADRPRERASEPGAERGVVVEGDSCGGGEKKEGGREGGGGWVQW